MKEHLLPREFPGARLRRLRVSDVPAFQAYRALPGLGRFQGWVPMSDAAAHDFLAAMNRAAWFVPGQWLQLGIADAPTDALIGDIGLHLSADGATGQIGFTLSPGAQGRGIATHAVQAALDVLFTATTITQVQGITDARNNPSIRLLERLGFTCRESRQTEFRGEACVEHTYALSRNRLVSAR